MADARSPWDARFETVENGIGVLDRKVEALDQRVVLLARKVDVLDRKFETRFDSVDRRFDTRDQKIDSQVQRLDSKIDVQVESLAEGILWLGERMDRRFDQMEAAATKDRQVFLDVPGRPEDRITSLERDRP